MAWVGNDFRLAKECHGFGVRKSLELFQCQSRTLVGVDVSSCNRSGNACRSTDRAFAQLRRFIGSITNRIAFMLILFRAIARAPRCFIQNRRVRAMANRVLKNADAAFQHFKSRYNYAA